MTSSVVSRRYAQALFDLAVQEGRVQDLGEELTLLARTFREVPALAGLLSNPAYTRAERKAIASRLIAEGLRLCPGLKNLLFLLIENGRVRDLPAIVDRYQYLSDEAAGRAHVILWSAAPLSEGDRRRVEEGLSRVTGKQVTLDVQIDPSLIGGLAAQVGSLAFDGSVRAQIEALKQELRRASS